MSKCRYDLSEDCSNKDCVGCVLDRVRAEIIEKYWDCNICKYNGHFNIRGDISDILQILDKYKSERDKEDNKVKNPMIQTLDFLKNLYLQNKEEIDRVAKEYKVIEADKSESEDK